MDHLGAVTLRPSKKRQRQPVAVQHAYIPQQHSTEDLFGYSRLQAEHLFRFEPLGAKSVRGRPEDHVQLLIADLVLREAEL